MPKAREYMNESFNVPHTSFTCWIDETTCWNIFHSYFTYKTHPKEEEGSFIYVVNFDKNLAIIKINDFVKDDSCK